MLLAQQKVVVTGGAGAIGSALCRRILAEGCSKLVVIDDLSSGFKENLPTDNRVQFVQGSITDPSVLKQVFVAPCDVVFHLAAHFANQNSVDHPTIDLEVNGLGTLYLLEHALQTGVKRFIFASSSCVYGNQAGALSENQALLSLDTPYAITKLLGEQYVNFFQHFHKLPTVILRYFNSFGPGERPGKYRNVIPNFIAQALRGQSLVITGTGDETRDFTYIDNTVEGTLRAAISEQSIGKTYNIGAGREVKIIELAKTINHLTKNTAPIVFKPRRAWDSVEHRCANITAAQTDFVFSPDHDFNSQLTRTVEWFKSLPPSVLNS